MLNQDQINDLKVRIVWDLVLAWIIKDCTDTDDETEFQAQDIISDILEKEFSLSSISEKINKRITQQKELVNQKDEDWSYTLEHYRNEVEMCQKYKADTPLEAVEECDFDTVDFNIWFEQWYIRWMEEIKNLFCNWSLWKKFL